MNYTPSFARCNPNSNDTVRRAATSARAFARNAFSCGVVARSAAFAFGIFATFFMPLNLSQTTTRRQIARAAGA